MTLQDRLSEYSREGRGNPGYQLYNFETLSGVLIAARQKKKPLILQLSESSIQYMGLKIAANMARTALKNSDVEGWLHLDHGSSVDMAHRCLDAGFDSVMIDASEKPFDENVRITSHVVKLAGGYGANVEAEPRLCRKAWTRATARSIHSTRRSQKFRGGDWSSCIGDCHRIGTRIL